MRCSLHLTHVTLAVGLFGWIATVAAVDTQCAAARPSAGVERLPDVWQAAIKELILSTEETGHPWSCAGGTVELQLEARGGSLSIAREGAAAVTRHVAAPADVLPLGQALLALPLAGAAEHTEPLVTAAPVSAPTPQPSRTPDTLPPQPPPSDSEEPRSLLLQIGVDGRGVGGSGVAWLGPSLSAGLKMGRWLPSISLRQQSSLSDGPSIDELSVALALQVRFALGRVELRAGPALRGAVVQRDLSHKRGDQSRLDGSVGILAGVAIPVLSWANIVVSADANVVAFSREMARPDASPGDAEPAAFPTYTLGGSVCFEVTL